MPSADPSPCTTPRKRARRHEENSEGLETDVEGTQTQSTPRAQRKLEDDQVATLMTLFNYDTQPTTARKQVIAQELGVDLYTISAWYRKRRKALEKRCPIDSNGKPLITMSPSPRKKTSPPAGHKDPPRRKSITIDELAESAQKIRVSRTRHKRRTEHGGRRGITLEWACEQQAQRWGQSEDAWSAAAHASDAEGSVGGSSISVGDAYETRPSRYATPPPPQSETASEAALSLLSLSGSVVVFPGTS
ncbi:uncharacterized protein SCHCODRAFT_02565648 [Schizophyllum commune H4-8]|nr:uncharacterized protein SCHCODRAFT_02565648 [Schizophyllum commune H4-8]KAI5898017.1 hypothetical protein SCHCODRAFT_02565648 [Schizophyllum commune H4-8]